ncbi:helix-turn-helix domain-containing protein [Rhizobium sp. 768_B6_N1_8]|uniref:helix-turn-helix domain-containing protein n=1 Tax=unclassified Rhizobium TaxID=2613769 RepID=UPI003F1F7A23
MAKTRTMTHVAPEDGSDPPAIVTSIGGLLAAARKKRGWTLHDLSEESGVAVGTLSKVENGKSGASFDTVARVSMALEISFDDLLGPNSPKFASGRRSIARAGEGKKFGFSSYDYEVACNDLVSKAMVPLIMDIKAKEVLPRNKWASHPGEEFIYVLSGTVEMHTEFYGPVLLNPGDGAYIDSMMAHAFVSAGEGVAKMLSICLSSSLSELFKGRKVSTIGGLPVSFDDDN